jgi:hypothetical protein
MVYYPFHPLYKKKIKVQGTTYIHSEPHYVTFKPDGRKTYIPVWITDPLLKNIKIKDKPIVSIKTLYELKRLLYIAFPKNQDVNNKSLDGEDYEKETYTVGTLQNTGDPGRDNNEIKTTTNKGTADRIDSVSMGKRQKKGRRK